MDVSSDHHGASAGPVNGEALLFRAYGSVGAGQRGVFRVMDERRESCACGGTIVLSRGYSVEKVVEAHNETALHRAWRMWQAAKA